MPQVKTLNINSYFFDQWCKRHNAEFEEFKDEKPGDNGGTPRHVETFVSTTGKKYVVKQDMGAIYVNDMIVMSCYNDEYSAVPVFNLMLELILK